MGFGEFRDDAYMRDGLGQALACEAMLMGRNTYEAFSKIWPKRSDPWATRVNAMQKYVFSSRLDRVDWSNSTLLRGDVAKEVKQLKEQRGGDLLLYSHGLLSETLLKEGLVDVIDLAIHPIVAGQGRLFFRECEKTTMKLVATKHYSRGIVKLTYEPERPTGPAT